MYYVITKEGEGGQKMAIFNYVTFVINFGQKFQVFFDAIMRAAANFELNIRPVAIRTLQQNGFEDRVINKIIRK